MVPYSAPWRHLEHDPLFATLAQGFPDTAWSLRRQLTCRRAIDGVARLDRPPRDRPIPSLAVFATVRVPSLVLAHRNDPMHPLAFGRRLADVLPNARFVEVTPKSIDARLHAAQVQQLVATFLERYCAPAAKLGIQGRLPAPDARGAQRA